MNKELQRLRKSKSEKKSNIQQQKTQRNQRLGGQNIKEIQIINPNHYDPRTVLHKILSQKHAEHDKKRRQIKFTRMKLMQSFRDRVKTEMKQKILPSIVQVQEKQEKKHFFLKSKPIFLKLQDRKSKIAKTRFIDGKMRGSMQSSENSLLGKINIQKEMRKDKIFQKKQMQIEGPWEVGENKEELDFY